MHVLISMLLAATPPAPPADGAPAGEVAWLARRKLAASSRGDPPIAYVQEAAARWADPLSRDRGAQARARAAALLPRVTAEVRFDERSYRVVGLQSAGEVDYSRYAPGWFAGLRATWDLGALVAPAGKITEKGLLDRARRRDEAVRAATALFYERRRLRLVLEQDPPAEAGARAEAELEIERLAAELDALTGGAFTEGRR